MSARNIARVLAGAVLATTSSLLSAFTDTHSASAGSCPDIEVVFARGTDEPAGVGSVGQAFIDSLRPQLGERSGAVYAVNYPATEDYVSSSLAGAADARAHVQSMVAYCPKTRMVLGGYSQGASVMDTATNDLAQAVDHVAAVAVFGNPESTFARRLWGGRLATTSPLYQTKTIDLCVPEDPICSEGRNAAAHVRYVQSGMPSQAAAFVADRL
jgi:cutinase